MAEFIIRHVLRQDFDQWLELWDGYNAFYGREGETALRPEVTRATWSRLLDPAEPMHALVALTDRRIVGLAHYLFHRSTISIAPTCYLQDLFTLPEFRGHGVGAALVRRVFEEARTGASERVYWQTHESNACARRLYDQFAEESGFIVYRKFL
ncbi:MAG: GNAT family N-acetyltransferase [Sphingomicrobium sp.]